MAITIIRETGDGKEGAEMTYSTAISYACVAYRIMEYEGREQSEEYLDMLMGILYDFYTDKEIGQIYVQNIQLDSYTAIMKDSEIKNRINE